MCDQWFSNFPFSEKIINGTWTPFKSRHVTGMPWSNPENVKSLIIYTKVSIPLDFPLTYWVSSIYPYEQKINNLNTDNQKKNCKK